MLISAVGEELGDQLAQARFGLFVLRRGCLARDDVCCQHARPRRLGDQGNHVRRKP